jgi:hypothetical protein
MGAAHAAALTKALHWSDHVTISPALAKAMPPNVTVQYASVLVEGLDAANGHEGSLVQLQRISRAFADTTNTAALRTVVTAAIVLHPKGLTGERDLALLSS